MKSRWRLVVAIALALLGLLLAGIPIFMHPPTVYTGIHFSRAQGAARGTVIVDDRSPAFAAGLRTGDVLSCLSVRDYALLSDEGSMSAHGFTPGTLISGCIRRGTAESAIAIVGDERSRARPLYGNDFIASIRLVEYAIFLICGVLLVWGRPGLLSWCFLFYCLGNGPNAAGYANLTVLPSPAYLAYVLAVQPLDFVASGFLLLFTILVPDDRPTGWRRGAFFSGVALTAISYAFCFIALGQRAVAIPDTIFRLPEMFLATITVCTVGIRLATMDSSERSRFWWAAFAIVWGVLTIAIAHSVLPALVPVRVYAALLTIVMPIAMLYAVLRKHVIDLRFVLSRTAVYAVMTTTIVFVIGIVDWATSTYLHESRAAVAVDAAVTVGLALVLHRAYRWLEHTIDFLLFREKYEAEAYLERLAKTLPAAERKATVDADVVRAPYETLGLTMAALYERSGSTFRISVAVGVDASDVPSFDCDAELVRFLTSESRPISIDDLRVSSDARFSGEARPSIAVPLMRGNRLAAFALFGFHRSGTALDPDEVITLERLCESAARAYINLELDAYESLPSRLPTLPISGNSV